MNAPSEFVQSLNIQFDNRLRIRWSLAQREWQIEQKVGPHREAPIEENDDDMVRARDGYAYVMSVRNGTKMGCPECHMGELVVPVFETAEIVCPYCRMMGKKTTIVAGYFELNDRLLEHLRKIDPDRGGSIRLKEEADRRNEALWRTRLNDAVRAGSAEVSDRYNRLVGIPQVGYTGKELK